MKHNKLTIAGLWCLSLSLYACSSDRQHSAEKQLAEQQATDTVDYITEDKTDSTANYTTNYAASGKPYYHLRYALNSENLLQVDRYSLAEFEQNGGQFEVLLDKSFFPIQTPNCKSSLILRMPWVPPDKDVTAKFQLYQAILAVHLQQANSASVVLELNPYVQETERGLELTQCNVFFRHANSEYVSHTESLD